MTLFTFYNDNAFLSIKEEKTKMTFIYNVQLLNIIHFFVYKELLQSYINISKLNNSSPDKNHTVMNKPKFELLLMHIEMN